VRRKHSGRAVGSKSFRSANPKLRRKLGHPSVAELYELQLMTEEDHRKTARNAHIVLSFCEGIDTTTIGRIFSLSEVQIRRIIHRWMLKGIRGVPPGKSTGRPRKFGYDERKTIVRLVNTEPGRRRTGSNRWTLRSLQEVLAENKEISISKEHLRTIIHEEGRRWYLTRTWEDYSDRDAPKPDPEYDQKWARIQEIKEAPIEGVRRYSIDTTGNHSMIPQPGHKWAAKGKPVTRAARYKNDLGTFCIHQALDLDRDELFSIVRRQKRAIEIRELLRKIRKRDPPWIKQLIILDASPTHKAKILFEYIGSNNQEFVFTATYCSWMNPVEAHNAPVKDNVVNNSDFRSVPEASRAVHAYEKKRNWRKRNELVECNCEDCKKVLAAQLSNWWKSS